MKTFPITAGSVTCTAGEAFAVEAIGTGTTGYVWFVEVEGQVRSVELQTRSLQPGQALGAMGSERFEFICRHSGYADVRFDLKQPWADHPEQSFKLEVHVR